ncbi:ABC transporter ATP-binding protein [Roseateles toxinivorans]|uniref:Peptide/nickel transport system ATP-binding protein n=1 Tax=Roseateles toxinivorans TaxID=270368 RepID=A0A4R6QI87_9BURK|nr:ABC transporter ATP-binding protein [Roseateles toxinivorans]TDP61852.1 peptide/nickel transport system ATP-binding protein [Roseateles toxinivorans]
MSTPPLLEVSNLRLQFDTPRGLVQAIDGISFTLDKGEILGLVGESGSGKSQTGNTIMGLLDRGARITEGSIRFKGQELLGLPQEQLRRIRGNKIAMIFQDPMMTLNPVLRIDTQMVEAVLAHQNVGREAALKLALQALERVGIAAPEERLKCYPHQLSGGMRQRVVIAIALLNSPEIFIADEPTTALDVTIQSQILFEVQKLCRDTGAALIWITHDLAVVAALADRVCVMHRGKIVEQGTVDQILDTPQHPYTRGLMDAIPSRSSRGQRLRTMQPQDGSAWSAGSATT